MMSERRVPLKPGKIVCVGRNYAEHAKELGNAVSDRPLLFLKPPSAVIGPDEAIVLPRESSKVEHEGEIGAVLGHRLRKAREEDALRAIAGIVCVNDVTARDLQKTDAQWTRAKGFDTFCPAGPAVVPLDRLPPLRDLEVFCRVNGQERQHGHARDMIFGIPFLLAYISQVMTLEPGDLVATGSPPGVGLLTAGDVVEVEIPGVGVLRNSVTRSER
jgi:2-keto-4-pentenoate hydratase/2-oxohepta-3-ene-1,7-dioic acid hydratase in catechol pathway